MLPVLGERMQNDIWRTTLRNLAKHWSVDAPVEAKLVVVDPRRQWSNAKNIWQNAAIRSTVYAFGAPVRRLRRR
jgi:hypothetical protein